MYTASLENSRGDVIQLTGREADYQVYKIDGLNPPSAGINIASATYKDGGYFNGSKLETRNIVIYVKINGDAEYNRLELYKYCPTKENVTFYYSNGSRDVFIDGYVDSVECDPFDRSEEAQISIVCPDPYFKDIDMNTVTISGTTTIVNDSDSKSGILIEATAAGAVDTLSINNGTIGYFTLSDLGAVSGDVISINSAGTKYVRKTHSGTTSSIAGKIDSGSTFLTLVPGNNAFSYYSDGSVQVKVKWYTQYRGV